MSTESPNTANHNQPVVPETAFAEYGFVRIRNSLSCADIMLRSLISNNRSTIAVDSTTGIIKIGDNFAALKYAVSEESGRFTTVTQIKPSVSLPAFTLQMAPMFDLNLTGKSQNRIYPDTVSDFSNKFVLRSTDEAGVLALFNHSLCRELLADLGVSIESDGEHVIVFVSGQQIYKADDIDRFIKQAMRWVQRLEAAQIEGFADERDDNELRQTAKPSDRDGLVRASI